MVIATTAATAGISSATTDGGILNKLLKVAFIIAILGLLIIGYMWVTGSLSLSDVITEIQTSIADWAKGVFMKYTPVGWAISAVSGVVSLVVGHKGGFAGWTRRSFPSWGWPF